MINNLAEISCPEMTREEFNRAFYGDDFFAVKNTNSLPKYAQNGPCKKSPILQKNCIGLAEKSAQESSFYGDFLLEIKSQAGSGLYYFRARYYDAELGRFISRDPLGYVDGLNLYRGYFVPLGVDPSGMLIPLAAAPFVLGSGFSLGGYGATIVTGLGIGGLGIAITETMENISIPQTSGVQQNINQITAGLQVDTTDPWTIPDLGVDTPGGGEGGGNQPGGGGLIGLGLLLETMMGQPENTTQPDQEIGTQPGQGQGPLAQPGVQDPSDDSCCNLRFLFQQYHGGATKSCMYRRGNFSMFGWMQWKDRPCYPINPETCMVDTSSAQDVYDAYNLSVPGPR